MSYQDELPALSAQIERLVQQAREEARQEGFLEGFKRGGDAMRSAILRAAETTTLSVSESKEAPSAEKTGESLPRVYHAPPSDADRRRAPRGLVGRALADILTKKPGSIIPEIERAARIAYPEVSIKSLGNELRRLEGTRYRRDRPGGYRWYLTDLSKDLAELDEIADIATGKMFNKNSAGVAAPAEDILG